MHRTQSDKVEEVGPSRRTGEQSSSRECRSVSPGGLHLPMRTCRSRGGPVSPSEYHVLATHAEKKERELAVGPDVVSW